MRRSQYTSLAFTEALADAGIAGSIGTVGDALDNALLESTIGLYKTELIDRRPGVWSGRVEVERETPDWVWWFNTSRLHSSLEHLPPVESKPATVATTRHLRPPEEPTSASSGPTAIHCATGAIRP
jgi:transposase InsO family protein